MRLDGYTKSMLVAIPIYKVGIFYLKEEARFKVNSVAIPIYKVGIFYISGYIMKKIIKGVAIPIYKVGIFY